RGTSAASALLAILDVAAATRADRRISRVLVQRTDSGARLRQTRRISLRRSAGAHRAFRAGARGRWGIDTQVLVSPEQARTASSLQEAREIEAHQLASYAHRLGAPFDVRDFHQRMQPCDSYHQH